VTPESVSGVAMTAGPRVRRRSDRERAEGTFRLTRTSGAALGLAMLWFSILVLVPLIAVVVTASEGGWSAFWRSITNEQTAAAIRLTVGSALIVTVINVVMGTVIAWVLVRDDFVGKRALEVLIDIPFALPTIVAGLVLLSLYGPNSPLGIDVANKRPAVLLAFLFVTLPFVVRTVQPVLSELDREAEEAAASLGATRFTIFRRIVLPALGPAIAAGAALSFARAVSEYGSLVLLSGNLPLKTEVTSVRIFSSIENDNPQGAAAVATILLAISLAVIVAIDLLQRRIARRG
jgi:sulfate transport system permease protein